MWIDKVAGGSCCPPTRLALNLKTTSSCVNCLVCYHGDATNTLPCFWISSLQSCISSSVSVCRRWRRGWWGWWGWGGRLQCSRQSGLSTNQLERVRVRRLIEIMITTPPYPRPPAPRLDWLPWTPPWCVRRRAWLDVRHMASVFPLLAAGTSSRASLLPGWGRQ